jgi:EmrB/QacA subfamily drug resistance transporter
MPQPRRTNRARTVVGLILALAMAALEATVVSTAMPTVIGDLGGIHYYAWIANAYLLASSVTVPIYGKLADTYGRKPIMLFGIALFLFGSAACGAAQSMPQLIVFRAIQGLGAGSMQPMALTIVGDIFELEERGRIQGVFGAAWGFFGLTGPMLGGLIVHYLSWRWVFYVNLPFGIAAAALIVSSLHERVEKKQHRLDFLGAALLTAGVVALLLAASRINTDVTIGATIAALALLGAFVLVERAAKEPVLPLALFARPVMLVSSVAGAIVGGAMIATLTYVPLYVQGVLRGTPTQAGSAITPMVVGWPISSALAGRLITRVGFRPLIQGGLAITALAAVLLALFGEESGVWELGLITALFGVGMGFANTALLIAVQTSVSWDQRGIATASAMFFRTIGGALAVGVMGGVISAALSRDPTIPPDAANELLAREGGRALDPVILAHLGDALARGLATVFWIIAAMAVAAFISSIFFPQVVISPSAPKGPKVAPEDVPPNSIPPPSVG